MVSSDNSLELGVYMLCMCDERPRSHVIRIEKYTIDECQFMPNFVCSFGFFVIFDDVIELYLRNFKEYDHCNRFGMTSLRIHWILGQWNNYNQRLTPTRFWRKCYVFIWCDFCFSATNRDGNNASSVMLFNVYGSWLQEYFEIVKSKKGMSAQCLTAKGRTRQKP